MLWTLLTLAVWLMIGAGVLWILLQMVVGVLNLPENFRQHRDNVHRSEAEREAERTLLRTNRLAHFTPHGPIRDRYDIPWNVRMVAERYPVISRSAKAPEIAHQLEHWYTVRDNYGYLPMKARIHVRTVQREIAAMVRELHHR